MAARASTDMGNVAGKKKKVPITVPGANTALPTANDDAVQLKATEIS